MNDAKFLVGTMCFQICVGPLQGPHKPSFLIWGFLALTRIFFKLLALRNSIIATFLNTLICSLSGVKRRCILVFKFFNIATEGWHVILRTSFFSFSFFLCLLSSSVLENFLVFKICFRTNSSLYLLSLSHTSRSLHCLSKTEFLTNPI